ncbi:hypothetical protein [Pedobacter jejuensis]|uniref:Uncharacterized protein n=1 Tax=Pedobacter jejuensis TaxID=1268550 RepID=A0A3N0BRP5_9SPHI|nr:hypothetical protein [Pedobacter jejuensis]RNL51335.1 hypothetical protein D7004_16625 [Pedobacter jejuensis]
MVDRERRRKLAFHLRHLSVGVISNDDFESNLMDDVTNGWLPEQYYRAKEAKFDDQIIQPMLELCWGLYDDTRNHKLKGSDKLSAESLKIITRCILFLHSDQEYNWPYFDTNNPLLKFSFKEVVISILTLGQYYRAKRKEHSLAYMEFQKLGNFDIWPFMIESEYQTELTNQPFLNGKPNKL